MPRAAMGIALYRHHHVTAGQPSGWIASRLRRRIARRSREPHDAIDGAPASDKAANR